MRKSCGAILGALLLLVSSPSPAGESGDEKPGAAKSKPKTAAKETGQASKSDAELPATGYAKALRGAIGKIEVKESAGLKVKVDVIPDAYRYLMAEAYEELRKNGYPRWELQKKLRERYEKLKDKKGRVLFICELTPGGGKDHHFLQAALKDHVQVRSSVRKTAVVFDVEPQPAFESWQVFEQQREQRKVLKKQLAKLNKLKFRVTAPLKPEERDTLKISFRNLVRVTDRIEEQKKDYRAFEGINTSLRQISSNSWADQTVPEITFELHPGTWQIPAPPAGFDELLKGVEKG
jgi:hypothetical protein